jgi:tol-pal system protein YbgF
MLTTGGIRNKHRWFMARFTLGTTALTLAVLVGAAAGSVRAQDAERPFLLDRLFGPSDQRPAAPVGQDRTAQAPASDLVVRLDRMENQIRQLTGAVEQLQFRNQQLEGQLRRVQEDTDYRFQEMGGKGAARPPARPQTATPGMPPTATPAMPPTGTVPGKRGDAFDPAQNPTAPGAPQTLGSANVATATDPAAPRGPNALPPVGAVPSAPKDEFDVAYGYVVRKDYAGAEDALRGFLLKYPSDKLSPEAAYWLGETLFQRQRFRDAAEAFLNVSTKFETSPKAPDALFRLGQSLAALGEKEAACASLGEVVRKFPRASASLKQSVEREQKRVRC